MNIRSERTSFFSLAILQVAIVTYLIFIVGCNRNAQIQISVEPNQYSLELKRVSSFDVGSSRLLSLAFFDDQVILSQNGSGLIQFWSQKTGQKTKEFSLDFSSNRLSVSSELSLLIASSMGGAVVYNLADATVEKKIPGRSAATFLNNEVLCVYQKGGIPKVWDLRQREMVPHFDSSDAMVEFLEESMLSTVRYSTHGDVFNFRIFEVPSGDQLDHLDNSSKYSPDSFPNTIVGDSRYYAARTNGGVRVVRFDGNKFLEVGFFECGARVLSFSDCGKMLAVLHKNDKNDQLTIIDTSTGEIMGETKVPGDTVLAVGWNSESTQVGVAVASGGASKDLQTTVEVIGVYRREEQGARNR